MKAFGDEEFEQVLESSSREELLKLRAEIEDEMASIQLQLDAAHAKRHETGVFADSDWYRRAKAAHKIKGRLVARIQTRLSELGAQKRVQQQELDRLRERMFIDAARRLLEPEQYRSLWAEVDRQEPRP